MIGLFNVLEKEILGDLKDLLEQSIRKWPIYHGEHFVV